MNRERIGAILLVPGRTAVLILAFIVAGCAMGNRDVVVKPGSGFDRKIPAIILADHGDPDGVKSILEDRFRAHGFFIVSGMNEDPKFVIRFRYTSLLGQGIRDFEAAIFPAPGGDPIAHLRFQGRGMVDTNAMAEDLIARLEAQLK